jgi:hypothetical protein
MSVDNEKHVIETSDREHLALELVALISVALKRMALMSVTLTYVAQKR